MSNKTLILATIFLILFCFNAWPESSLMTDEDMGDFIAQEGVCNIGIPEDCVTAQKLVMGIEAKGIDPETIHSASSIRQEVSGNNPGFDHYVTGLNEPPVYTTLELTLPETDITVSQALTVDTPHLQSPAVIEGTAFEHQTPYTGSASGSIIIPAH